MTGTLRTGVAPQETLQESQQSPQEQIRDLQKRKSETYTMIRDLQGKNDLNDKEQEKLNTLRNNAAALQTQIDTLLAMTTAEATTAKDKIKNVVASDPNPTSEQQQIIQENTEANAQLVENHAQATQAVTQKTQVAQNNLRGEVTYTSEKQDGTYSLRQQNADIAIINAAEQTGETPKVKEAAQRMLHAYIANLDGRTEVGLTDNRNIIEANNQFNLFGKNGQKYSIGELQLFNILQMHPKSLTNFLDKNASAERSQFLNNLDLNNLKKFSTEVQKKLLDKVRNLSQIQQLITGNPGDASVDIVTVLNGKEGDYVQELLRKKQERELVGLKDKTPEGQKSAMEKIAQFLLSVGVTMAFPMAYVRYESRDLKIPTTGEKPSDGHPLSVVLGNGPQNLTAKLGLLSATAQANFNDQENGIYQELAQYAQNLKKLENKNPLRAEDFENIGVENTEAIQVYLNNQDKIPFNSLVDMLVYNKAVAIAETSGWKLKGAEATVALPSMKLNVGLAGQKLGVTYVESDAKVANSVTEKVGVSRDNISVEPSRQEGKYFYTIRGIKKDVAESIIQQVEKFNAEGDFL